MTTISVRFTNSNDAPIFVQVDPWAGLYVLEKGEEIELVAESQSSAPAFHIEEHNNTRILTILHSSDYFVVKDGTRIPWSQYQSNYKEWSEGKMGKEKQTS